MMGRRCLGSAVREGRLRSCGRLIARIWRRGRVVLVARREGLRILFRRIRQRRSNCGCVGCSCGTLPNDVHVGTTLSTLIKRFVGNDAQVLTDVRHVP